MLALEDNYPFRQKHTAEDLPGIIRPASVQQMGEQTLAIARELGGRDLVDPWGEQETFFAVPVLGLIHYPESWSLPLAITAGVLLVLALGLSLWRGLTSWRGLGIAFGTILVTAGISVLGVSALQPRLSSIFGWETTLWPDWPEVIPPHGWLPVGLLGVLVLGLCVGGYILFRRWSSRADFSLVGLLPFAILAAVLAEAEPRTAYAFIWPVLIGSLSWVIVLRLKPTKWSADAAALVTALPMLIIIAPFLPGVVMSDGMKSLNILAGIEAALLGVILPAIDGLLVRHARV